MRLPTKLVCKRITDATKAGKMVRKAREEKGLSLRELARRMLISPPFLSDLELGRRAFAEDSFQAAFRQIKGWKNIDKRGKRDWTEENIERAEKVLRK